MKSRQAMKKHRSKDRMITVDVQQKAKRKTRETGPSEETPLSRVRISAILDYSGQVHSRWSKIRFAIIHDLFYFLLVYYTNYIFYRQKH